MRGTERGERTDSFPQMTKKAEVRPGQSQQPGAPGPPPTVSPDPCQQGARNGRGAVSQRYHLDVE